MKIVEKKRERKKDRQREREGGDQGNRDGERDILSEGSAFCSFKRFGLTKILAF